MISETTSPIAVLVSGGLDSCILVGHLIRQRRRVRPIHIATDLVWNHAEQVGLRRFLDAIKHPWLEPLVTLEMPLGDVYGDHWSVTGDATPDAASPDEAVFLPGRNALLLIKAAVWCQLNGVDEIAVATLGTSPFDDARDAFMRQFETAMNTAGGTRLKIRRPFGDSTKRQVMALGEGLPLEATFSCIHPIRGLHCGACNKCAERRAAFALGNLVDRTMYAHPATTAAAT